MKAHWISDDAAAISAADILAEGIHFEQHPVDAAVYQAPLDALKADKGYVEQDEVALSPATPGLDGILEKFVGEHLHDDDEVRFVLDGAGVFDIRSKDDRWMRIEVEPGDLIVVPAKRHHRFMLTEAKTIRCVRLFKDQSGWVPHYR